MVGGGKGDLVAGSVGEEGSDDVLRGGFGVGSLLCVGCGEAVIGGFGSVQN